MRATPEYLAKHLQPQLAALGIQVDDMAKLAAVAKSQQERAKTLKEMAQNSVFFFVEPQGYDEKAAKKNLTADAVQPLTRVIEELAKLERWVAADIHDVVNRVAAELSLGLGKVAQPIRVAVSGGAVSPPIDVTLEVLGRDTTLQRLQRAVAYCSGGRPA
jgi:glutamyl-tRNA synthetase